MLEHNENITFKNIFVNNSINKDLKNMFDCFYDLFCFLSLHKFNSIYIIFHYLVS